MEFPLHFLHLLLMHPLPPSSTFSTANLNNSINNLNTNLLVLREGGKTSNIELKPLSSKFLDSWKIINNDWNRFRNFITHEIVKPSLQQKAQLQLKTPGNMTTFTSKTVSSIQLLQLRQQQQSYINL